MKQKLLKTTTAFSIMGSMFFGASLSSAETPVFKDVPANHWSTEAINDLGSKQIFLGYGNGIFGFGDNVTRGQVARMLYNFLKPADVDGSFRSSFSDIRGHMFEKEIKALENAGIMNGYGNGTFGAENILTREQLASVLTKAFKLKPKSMTTFDDVEKNYWATDSISAVQSNGISIGMGNNTFEPKTLVKREQYVQFLYNTMKKQPDHNGNNNENNNENNNGNNNGNNNDEVNSPYYVAPPKESSENSALRQKLGNYGSYTGVKKSYFDSLNQDIASSKITEEDAKVKAGTLEPWEDAKIPSFLPKGTKVAVESVNIQKFNTSSNDYKVIDKMIQKDYGGTYFGINVYWNAETKQNTVSVLHVQFIYQ